MIVSKAWLPALLLFAAFAQPVYAVPAPGDTYVAMGSSYAAGPGVGLPADPPASPCARSQSNYAHQLASRLNLKLVDVSCSGATTASILKPWRGQPAQVEAVRPDTRLVTVTIGGNDLNYVGNLGAATCRSLATLGVDCPARHWPGDADYRVLKNAFLDIVTQIRLRAPNARIVFVEYPAVLPPAGTCARLPLADGDADALRGIAAHLAATTEDAGRSAGVDVLPIAELSKDHSACAAQPWMTGYFDATGQKAAVPFHPNLAGMTAVADAMERHLAPIVPR